MLCLAPRSARSAWVCTQRCLATGGSSLRGVTSTVPLHWGEMDAFAHLNNVAYFRHFETARIVHFNRLMDEAVALDPSFNPDGFIKGTGLGPILAATSCRYRRQVVYPDTLSTMSSVTFDDPSPTDAGISRFTMKYSVTSQEQGGAVVATGEGEIVMFDYRTNCKSHLCPVLTQAFMNIG